eukprot:Skav216926  [mRNA]  locus=scaffold1838:363272:365617:- [translate_table: standard]
MVMAQLSKLSKIKVDLQVRAKLAHQAANHKALYGTPNYFVGKKWLQNLRTAITGCLVPDRKCPNPHLSTELLSPYLQDPEHFVIQESIRHVRNLLYTFDTSHQKAFFAIAAKHSTKPLSVRGPAGALATNLSRVGWSITKMGVLYTDTQIEFHIMHSCQHAIFRFLQYSWMKHITQTALERSCWRNLPTPDRHGTLHVFTHLTPAQQNVVAKTVTGAFVSTAQKKHFLPEDTQCALCMQDETLEHKYLHCEATAATRLNWPSLLAFLGESDGTFMHLPVLYHDPDHEFRVWYFSHRPAPDIIPEAFNQLCDHCRQGTTVWCYTDGSCQYPDIPSARRAACAAVWHPAVSDSVINHMITQYQYSQVIPSTFQALFVSECIGHQTIPRAELQAVCHVVDMLVSADLPHTHTWVDLYTDSQYVLDSISRLGTCLDYAEFHRWNNFDTLRVLWSLLQRTRIRVHKVRAHQLPEPGLSHSPSQIIHYMGNEAVDHVAKTFLAHLQRQYPLGPLAQQPQQALENKQVLADFYTYVHQLQQQRAKLLQPRLTALPTHQTWQEDFDALFSHPGPFDWTFEWPSNLRQITEACMWGTAQAQSIVNWLSTLRWLAEPADSDSDIGTSWCELTFAYLVQTGSPIAINHGGQGKHFQPAYLRPDDPNISFSQVVFSFQSTCAQLETLGQLILLCGPRRLVKSLQRLGTRASQGIANRVQYPQQREILTHLQTFFMTKRTDDCTCMDYWPGYPPIAASPISFDHSQDQEDKRRGWEHRYARYNQCRKNKKTFRR